MYNEFSRQILGKILEHQISENLSTGSRVLPGVKRTDRHEANSNISKFCKLT